MSYQKLVPNYGSIFLTFLPMDPQSVPRIEGPHSAGGSTQVHEGPHRDHGHVLHNAKHGHGPIRVLKGSQGTTNSMVPLRSRMQSQNRDQNLVPDFRP